MKAFRTKSKGLGGPAGTICYPSAMHDYGLSADDTRSTGREHRSYTLKAFGGPPSFTHPVDDMEAIEAPDVPRITEQHVFQVCRVGKGPATCKYLTSSSKGWSCAKLSPDCALIDGRRGMVAAGDNCEGRACL